MLLSPWNMDPLPLCLCNLEITTRQLHLDSMKIHGVMEMRKQAISLIELHHQSLTTQQPMQYTPGSHHIQNLQEGIILPDIAISPRSRNWTPCSKKCCLESTNCNFDLSSHALHCIQICHPMYFLLVYHCFVMLLPEICQCYTVV